MAVCKMTIEDKSIDIILQFKRQFDGIVTLALQCLHILTLRML